MSQDPNNPPQTNPVLRAYQDWSAKTTFVTRTSMIGIVIVYITSWVFNADMALSNIPYFTVDHFELYRLILSPLVGNSFITIIFIALFFPVMGTKMELMIGSTAYLYLLFALTILINIGFDVFCLLFYVVGSAEAMFWSCSGFWTVIFSLLTIDCMQNPDAPRRMMFIPMDIPGKYFPILLFGLFSLLGGGGLGNAFSLACGYAYSYGYLDKVKLSAAFAETLEREGGFLHSCVPAVGWITTSGAGGELPTSVPPATTMYSSGGGGASTARPSAATARGVYDAVPTQDPSVGGNHNEPGNPFPGSGRSLGSGGGSSAYSTISMFQQNPTAAESAKTEKEKIAARRLAALEQGSGGNNESGK